MEKSHHILSWRLGFILVGLEVDVEPFEHEVVLDQLADLVHLTFHIFEKSEIENDLLKFDVVLQSGDQVAEVFRLDLDLLINLGLEIF